MIEDSKLLLGAMGLPAIQAPSEGEALCSFMARKGDVYAAATQDYDSLLYGCPRLVRNLSITGKRKRGKETIDVKPEIILLKNALEKLGINQSQLIMLGILVGTEYNPGGVAGFGPKRALELVKEKKTLDAVLEGIAWDFDVSAEEIYEFFKNPKTGEYKIDFGGIDEHRVKKLLCGEHDFSEERIGNALAKLTEEKPRDQKSLEKWF